MNEGREKEGLTGRRRTFERDWSVGEKQLQTRGDRAEKGV